MHCMKPLPISILTFNREFPPHICCIVSRDSEHRFQMLSSKIGMLPLVANWKRPLLEFTWCVANWNYYCNNCQKWTYFKKLYSLSSWHTFHKLLLGFNGRQNFTIVWAGGSISYQCFMLLNASVWSVTSTRKSIEIIICRVFVTKFIWLIGCLTSWYLLPMLMQKPRKPRGRCSSSSYVKFIVILVIYKYMCI